MKAKIREAVDGRSLVVVRFRRMSPTGYEPDIEAVFHLHWPEDFTLSSSPFVLMPLSVTRTDTRETETLLPHEVSEVLTEAVVVADRYDRSLLGGDPSE